MPHMVDDEGNIWDVDDQGNVKGFVGRQQQSQQPRAVITPMNPFAGNAEHRAQQDQAFEAERVRLAREEAARNAATAPAEIRKAEADATKAEVAAQTALTEKQAAPNPEMSRIKTTLQTDNVLGNIAAARRQIQAGGAAGNFFGGGFWQGVPGLGQGSSDLAASLSGIEGAVINDTLNAMRAMSSTGASGMGALSEKEGSRLAASVAALQQTQSPEELMRNLATLERHYRNSLAILNNEDPRSPDVAEKYGILSGETARDGTKPGTGEVTSEGQFERDPALAGANAKVRDMIARGKTAQDIRGYLNRVQPGLGDTTPNIEEAVTFAGQNPGKQEDWLNVDIEKKWVPAGGISRALGDIGRSPFGSALIGAGDTASMGLLDNLTGDSERTRAVMGGLQEENPNAYLAGQVLGGVSTGLGLENLAGRAGLSGLNAARAGEVAYGAGYGAGSADESGDSRIAGALLGGGAGLAGGALGRGAARGVGRAVSGVTDAHTRLLGQSGVRMTPGQILGGGLKRAEDKMTSWPVVGGMISGARREGVEDFNRAAMAEAVSPIGAAAPRDIGEAGVLANQGAISQAYQDALGGSQVMPDQPFVDDLASAVTNLRNIPRVGEEVIDTVGEIVNPTYFTGAGGELPGTNMQPMLQELRGLRSSYATDPLGNRVGGGVRDVESAVTGMFERQAPDVMPAFNNANAAYRNQSVIEDAVLKGRNTGGVFTPAQLGISSVANAGKFGGKRQAAAGNRPFFELQRAAQETLPSQIPDSGTAGRMLLPALIAGGVGGGGGYAAQEGDVSERAGGAAGGAIIASLLAAAPYSAPARAALQKTLLAERPELMMRFGNTLLDNQRIAGLLAAPSAVGMVSGQ